MSQAYDVVVIGSGFGGAVVSCRLTQAGRKVVILERGRRWSPETFPRDPDDAWVWDQDDPQDQNGWVDFRFLDDMWIAQGAGVGGGSLIYANVSIDAKPEVFSAGWPSEITYDELKPYYAMVKEMLGSRPIPDGQITRRFALMKEGAAAIGAAERFRKLDLAVTFNDDWSYKLDDPVNPKHSKTWTNAFGKKQGTCVHCGTCDAGCEVQARNTLDLNYIALAESKGAEVRPLSLATHISPADGGWRVHYDRLEDGQRIPQDVLGKRVVVAAGSLGSTELMLRSRDEYRTLPKLGGSLGHNWSSNGDFLTPAFYEGRRISPSVGPTITCAIDFLDGSQDGLRYFVEDGGFPNVLGNFLNAELRRASRFGLKAKFLRYLKGKFDTDDPLSNMMPWFGQAIDASDGRLYLSRYWYAPWRRKLSLDWDAARSERVIDGLIAMHKRLAEATGGRILVPPTWTVLRNLVTPHPLGGCSMAAAPAVGVVDHAGRVFHHPGLYVADGAIVPRAIGLNPSKTIAALAERIAKSMLGEQSTSLR